MLIQNWSPTVHHCPNHIWIKDFQNENFNEYASIKITWYKNRVPTIPVSEFPAMTPLELQELITAQQNHVKKEANTLFDYWLLTQKSKNITLQFYQDYYAYETTEQTTPVFLNIKELENYIHTLHARTTTYNQIKEQTTQQPSRTKPPTNDNTQHNNTQTISVQAIRDVTGYSTTPFIHYLQTTSFIKWQDTLLTYAHTPEIHEIVVDGSRQMWKSKTTAEILTESSFIPWFHQLVAAPSQDLTNLIKNYIQEYTSSFEEELFLPRAKERYILNTFSGSRIHFLTLKEEWQKALWLTLSRIIIDEAQLVSVPTVIESLKPTMTTTNWQLILIGTAIANTNSYMYQSLMEAKKWLSDTKYITVSADDNPFITPNIRKEIELALQNPLKREAYLRQYYNKWGWGEHMLFRPPETDEYLPNPDATIIIANDPARSHDKSAYSILEVTEWKCITIKSWQIPETHKKDWTLQRKYMLSIREYYQKLYAKVVTVMDWTGVGDGVVTIFEQWNYAINYVIKYTSSDTTNISKTEQRTLKVGKSVLINNALDMQSEWIHTIFTKETESLQEELNFLEADYDSMWRVRMKTSFFDDEINAMMLTLYISTKFWIHTRPTKHQSLNKDTQNQFAKEVLQAYPNPPRRQRQHRSNYF